MTTTILTILTALGAATFGGAMFAFSGFVMFALDRTPTRAAVLAMQEINLAAPRPPLVTVMVGTTLTSLAVVVLSVVDLVRGDATPATWLSLAGCAGFLASMVITGQFHIPRNNAFASVDAGRPGRGHGVDRVLAALAAGQPRASGLRPRWCRPPGRQPDRLSATG